MIDRMEFGKMKKKHPYHQQKKTESIRNTNFLPLFEDDRSLIVIWMTIFFQNKNSLMLKILYEIIYIK